MTQKKPFACITCQQPLPENIEEYHYFGQYSLETCGDVLSHAAHLVEELGTLSDYLHAVLVVISESENIDVDTPHELRRLAEELCREVQHRRQLLRDDFDSLWEEQKAQKAQTMRKAE